MNETHIICKILGGVDKVNEYLHKYIEKNKIDAKNLHYLTSGESSLVFETDDSIIKMTRIKYFDKDHNPISLTEYTASSKYILKPQFEDELTIGEDSIIFYVQEKLKIEDITPKELYGPYKHLKDDKYTICDLRADNFGIDCEGKIVLHDYGQLFNERMYKKGKMQQIEDYHQTRCPEYSITYKLEQNGIKKINGVDVFDIIKLVSYDTNLVIFLHLNRESKEEKEKKAKAISILITKYINNELPIEFNIRFIFRALDIVMKYDPFYYISLVPKVKKFVGNSEFETGRPLYRYDIKEYNIYIEELKKEDREKTKKKTK